MGAAPPEALDFAVGELVTLRNFTQRERARMAPACLCWVSRPPGSRRCVCAGWAWLSPTGRLGGWLPPAAACWQDCSRRFRRYGLPDPSGALTCPCWRASIAGTHSTIHGDLNLENVLVGPGEFVWLIDFAQTRDGHPLFDFAHLEAELHRPGARPADS